MSREDDGDESNLPREGSPTDSTESLSNGLNGETAVIAWSELVRHFARGVVIHVSSDLDLVDAAVSVASDDTAAVSQWLESGMIRRASDDDARDWTRREPEFWCVVTAPWVLVQERDSDIRPGQRGPGTERQVSADGGSTTLH